MNGIISAVILVCAIGLIAGIGLSIASVVMAVPKDEKAEQIRECLPGANCGACGFSGCDGYASALSKGETTKTNLCAPGGSEAAKGIAEVLGVKAESVEPMVAFVRCNGTSSHNGNKLEYAGVQSCKLASQLFGGPKDCIYGCIGFGDCVKECEKGALKICDGVARVDPMLCKACKKCMSVCPKNLIELMPLHKSFATVTCRNQDKGALTRKACDVGCIGCMKCVKVCESQAVTVENNVASVDVSKCTNCGKCVEACPTKAIKTIIIE